MVAREVLLPYRNMAALNSTGGKSKQKKKSAPKKPRRRSNGTPRQKAPALKKPVPPAKEQPITMGRMERTRRLLLAALRVWELKRRPLD